MEPNDFRSLDWKICFKKILAPHLLKPSTSEERNIDNDVYNLLQNPKCDRMGIYTLQNYLERSESLRNNSNSSITKESVETDQNNQQYFNALRHNQKVKFPDRKLNNCMNPEEPEENITSIIAADAEELGKSLKTYKVSKKNKYFYKAESSRSAPDWNDAFKKILSPTAATDSSIKTPTLEPHQLKIVDPSFVNPWTFHRLSREDSQLREQIEELPVQSSITNSDKRHYTKAEKNTLEMLRLSRSFKQKKKPHINIFDGAGVDCFKNEGNKFRTENISLDVDKPRNLMVDGDDYVLYY